MIDDVDRAIMTVLQDGFPLVPRPYEDKAAELGLSEQELIDRIARMRESGIVTRFGPFLNAERIGGGFCLCAMAVPPGSLRPSRSMSTISRTRTKSSTILR